MKTITNVYTDYIALDKSIEDIKFETIKVRHKIDGEVVEDIYCNNIMSCDIETSSGIIYDSEIESFRYDEELNKKRHDKYALCYFWSFAIEDETHYINRYYGRTLESFKKFVDELNILLPDIIWIIYIHNASFEFQFFRNIFNDMKVFARKTRHPIYFQWKNFIFRCSYMLVRLSLRDWAVSKKLPHRKMIGDLEYTKIRTPYSMMSESEINYGIIDSIIVVEGIREFKETYKTVYNIPLTQTGIVRKEVNTLLVKESKLHRKNRDNYPDNLTEYKELVSIFGGAITMANYIYADKTLINLRGRDATSAYPWHMESKLFPSTRFLQTDNYGKYIDNPYVCYYIEVEYYDIQSLFWLCYISISKCIKTVGAVCVNGRIQSADYIRIRVTDCDYRMISRSYKSKSKKILNFKYAIASPLNNKFRIYLLDLFENKCTLDGINEKLYAKSKESLNGMYGNMVTKELVDDVLYEYNKWDIKKLTPELFDSKVEKILEKMYKLNFSYAQGVWIPAYQRESLWSFVPDLDSYIVYMDTDSHKYFSDEYTEEVFERYNSQVRIRQEEVARELGVDISRFRPITPKGKQKSLGEYVIEEEYSEFKTLGAKRYAYKDKQGKIHLTISGVNKEKGAAQLQNIDDLKEGYTFDYEHSGALTMTYLDSMDSIWYNKGKYDEFLSNYQYGICGEPSTYTPKLEREYKYLIAEIKASQTRLVVEK